MSREFDQSLAQHLLHSTPIDFYSESNQDAFESLSDYYRTRVAQSFVAKAGVLVKVQGYIKKAFAPTGNMYAKLYSKTNGAPAAVLATSLPRDVSEFVTPYQLRDFEFTDGFLLVDGTTYFISFEYTGGDNSNYVYVGADNSSPTHPGEAYHYDGSWALQTYDVCFYVNPDHPLQDFPLTIAAWIWRDNVASNHALVGIRDNSEPNYGISSFILYGSNITYKSARFMANGPQVITTTGMTAGQWHHVCGVASSNILRAVYLDGGGKEESSTEGLFPSGLDVLRIGSCGQDGLTIPFDGLIAHVSIWDVPLNDAEVLQLANKALPTDIRGEDLIAYWPLVDNDLDTIGGFHLTPINSPTWSEKDPFGFVGGQPLHNLVANQMLLKLI